MRLVRSLFYPDGLAHGMYARTERACQKRIAKLGKVKGVGSRKGHVVKLHSYDGVAC